MTTRKPRITKVTKAEETTQETTQEKPKQIPTKRVRPPRSNMVFIGEEDMRDFEAYKKFLKEEQGIKDIRHKKV